MSDKLNLSHSHRNILFYCVLAVKYSSEKINVNVCSSMSYDILSVCNLIVMYVYFYKAVNLHSEVVKVLFLFKTSCRFHVCFFSSACLWL